MWLINRLIVWRTKIVDSDLNLSITLFIINNTINRGEGCIFFKEGEISSKLFKILFLHIVTGVNLSKKEWNGITNKGRR